MISIVLAIRRYSTSTAAANLETETEDAEKADATFGRIVRISRNFKISSRKRGQKWLIPKINDVRLIAPRCKVHRTDILFPVFILNSLLSTTELTDQSLSKVVLGD